MVLQGLPGMADEAQSGASDIKRVLENAGPKFSASLQCGVGQYQKGKKG